MVQFVLFFFQKTSENIMKKPISKTMNEARELQTIENARLQGAFFGINFQRVVL